MNNIINSPDALVAYLDMLGYKDAVHNNPGSNQLVYYKAIDNAICIFQAFFKGTEDYNLVDIDIVRNNISLTVFSDAIIIVLDQFKIQKIKKDSRVTLDYLLNIFSFLISILIHDCLIHIKHLFRGAIVKGHYYHKEFDNLKGNNFVFSKALCEAYRDAETIADTPRILVHHSVSKSIDVDNFICNDDFPANPLLIDSDGLYYLNVYRSFLNNPKAALSTSRCLTSVLREGMEKYKDPSRYRKRRKWAWFSNYHNEMIERMVVFSTIDTRYKKFETQRNSLLVSGIEKV